MLLGLSHPNLLRLRIRTVFIHGYSLPLQLQCSLSVPLPPLWDSGQYVPPPPALSPHHHHSFQDPQGHQKLRAPGSKAPLPLRGKTLKWIQRGCKESHVPLDCSAPDYPQFQAGDEDARYHNLAAVAVLRGPEWCKPEMLQYAAILPRPKATASYDYMDIPGNPPPPPPPPSPPRSPT